MSRTYSASTRRKLWRLVTAIALISLPKNIGTKKKPLGNASARVGANFDKSLLQPDVASR
jgi:hypothetical protein